MFKINHIRIFTSIFIIGFLSSCGVSYSLNGGSIPEGMKTVTVYYFENYAPIVNPTLSENFTEALKTRIRTQSRLSQVSENGDGIFEGTIVDYKIGPAAVEATTDRAALTRLTISIKVKYTNDVVPKDNFDKTFTKFKDFASPTPTVEQENQISKDIIDMITEDVFNQAFANW